MVRLTFAALLVHLSASAPAAAEWRSTDPKNREVVAVNPQTLRDTLQEIGAREVPGATTNPPGMIMTEFPNRSRVIIHLTPCAAKKEGCFHLRLASSFQTPPGMTAESVKEALLSYLARYPFVSLSLGTKAPIMTRGVVSDFGIQRGNLIMELVAFSVHVQQFGQHLNSQAATQ